MSAKISVLEQRPSPDANEPQLTAGLVPVADKLIQDLNEPDLTAAKHDSEQLAAQIHKQHELYRDKQVLTPEPGGGPLHGYIELSSQLQESLRTGDIAAAVALAVEVQTAEEDRKSVV